MKRDYDLVRWILLEIEKSPAGETVDKLSFPEQWDDRVVAEHVHLLAEGGFIDGVVRRLANSPSTQIIVRGLTWKGHDFIDASRDNTIWKKATDKMVKDGATLSFDVLLELLKTYARIHLGL